MPTTLHSVTAIADPISRYNGRSTRGFSHACGCCMYDVTMHSHKTSHKRFTRQMMWAGNVWRQKFNALHNKHKRDLPTVQNMKAVSDGPVPNTDASHMYNTLSDDHCVPHSGGETLHYRQVTTHVSWGRTPKQCTYHCGVMHAHGRMDMHAQLDTSLVRLEQVESNNARVANNTNINVIVAAW